MADLGLGMHLFHLVLLVTPRSSTPHWFPSANGATRADTMVR